jgi:hypothetical protein
VIKVRRAAIGFTLLSTFYWIGVAGLWDWITLLNYPYWLVLLTSTLPVMLYAAFSVWFCARLARSVMRQTMAISTSKSGEAGE